MNHLRGNDSVSLRISSVQEILEKLLAQKCQNFPQLCKASSECGSALKGGADNGDLGWLDAEPLGGDEVVNEK